MKQKIKYLWASLTVAVLGVIPAFAQKISSESRFQDVLQNTFLENIKNWGKPIANIAIVAIGLAALIKSVPAYISAKSSHNGGEGEALKSIIITFVLMIGFILLVNAVIFG